MTIGEKLLKLTAEYQDAANRESWGTLGTPARSQADIAADYETALLELIARP